MSSCRLSNATHVALFFIVHELAFCWLLLITATPALHSDLSVAHSQQLPIIPGIKGFGTLTPAGSGRHLSPVATSIITISSLADFGPGTLRDCLARSIPRICIFEVGGEIRLRSMLKIRSPFLTVAGQTAPNPGITITGGGISIETHDVLLQHVAIRPGDLPQGVPPRIRDGVSVGGNPPQSAYRIVLDHLSLTWALDENLSTWGDSTQDITVANSIIAEGLHRSIHPKGPHSKGIMVGNGSSRITLYRNLLAFNEERNPYLKPGSSSEVVNNVVYGWGSRGAWSLCNLTNNDNDSAPVVLSFIGNSYIAAPWSFINPPVYAKRIAYSSRIYLLDNRLESPLSPSRNLPDWEATLLPEYPYRLTSPPFTSPGPRPSTSEAAYTLVLSDVGSRPFNRSRVDRRIIQQVRQRRGSIKDCLHGCARSVDPVNPIRTTRRRLMLPERPNADDNNDGYTNIENWLFSHSKP
jgi:hypothetical protein